MHDATEHLYTVDTGYANAGVVVRGGVIIEAAPIFHWMIGKRWAEVVTWPKIVSWYDHATGKTTRNR
jgi:hypothetical protein